MDKKLFIALFFSFIAATIIGTLSHELGHYLVARYFGYDASISYGMTYWNSTDPANPVTQERTNIVSLGGPLQTLLTGTIGLIFLFRYRHRFFYAEKLLFWQWLLIFLALFWLRQTANFCMWLTSYFFNGELSSRSDEVRVAAYFALPAWTLISITAIIGAGVLALILFKFIPPKQRRTFIISGFLGGITGYYFWLVLCGKYIIP